jgi:hypothetical protein
MINEIVIFLQSKTILKICQVKEIRVILQDYTTSVW